MENTRTLNQIKAELELQAVEMEEDMKVAQAKADLEAEQAELACLEQDGTVKINTGHKDMTSNERVSRFLINTSISANATPSQNLDPSARAAVEQMALNFLNSNLPTTPGRQIQPTSNPQSPGLNSSISSFHPFEGNPAMSYLTLPNQRYGPLTLPQPRVQMTPGITPLPTPSNSIASVIHASSFGVTPLPNVQFSLPTSSLFGPSHTNFVGRFANQTTAPSSTPMPLRGPSPNLKSPSKSQALASTDPALQTWQSVMGYQKIVNSRPDESKKFKGDPLKLHQFLNDFYTDVEC